MRILVVEDDEPLAEGVARGLRQQGMAVDVSSDGEDALRKLTATDYDVVVLDRDLPVVHGDDVARRIIDGPSSPRILMLTAATSLEDRIGGLDLGADDYVTKPFAMTELGARIRALARRPSRADLPTLVHGDLVVDRAAFHVTRAGRPIRLTRKELGVLSVLMTAFPRVVGSEELLERVWDERADPLTNAPRIAMMTLRRKLGEPPVIETIVGVGYRLI